MGKVIPLNRAKYIPLGEPVYARDLDEHGFCCVTPYRAMIMFWFQLDRMRVGEATGFYKLPFIHEAFEGEVRRRCDASDKTYKITHSMGPGGKMLGIECVG